MISLFFACSGRDFLTSAWNEEGLAQDFGAYARTRGNARNAAALRRSSDERSICRAFPGGRQGEQSGRSGNLSPKGKSKPESHSRLKRKLLIYFSERGLGWAR